MNDSAVWKALTPWFVLILAYFAFAYDFNQEAPGSRIFPTIETFGSALRWMFEPHSVEGSRPIIADTVASVKRLLVALICSTTFAMTLSLMLNQSSGFRSFFLPSIVTLAKVPVIALLPLLLAWGGYGEFTRITLVLLGIVPVMTLMIYENLHQDDKVLSWKLDTLDLPDWQVILFVKIPMMIRHSSLALQTQLGPAWLFLLVAETFGTNEGLGYRLNIFRSRNWMDITILYVLWIATLAVILYFILDQIRRKWDWTWR